MTDSELEIKLESAEAGFRGKPDEFDKNLSNYIGAYILEKDPNARFDVRIEVGIKGSQIAVGVSGEVSDTLWKYGSFLDDLNKIVISQYNSVNKTSLKEDEFSIDFGELKKQNSRLARNGFSGDSEDVIGVALGSGPNNLPWERYIAVELRDVIDEIFQTGNVPEWYNLSNLGGMKPDGKISVKALYQGANLVGVPSITIAREHREDKNLKEIRHQLETLTRDFLHYLSREYSGFNPGETNVHVNPLGAWTQGGPIVDRGSREAKPQRLWSSHGVTCDEISGEDPSKPGGTGSYLARYIAVQIVANQLADYVKVSLSYNIGDDNPELFNVWTNGTNVISQESIERWVRSNFDLRFSEAIKEFRLRDPKMGPEIYKLIASDSDPMHNSRLPWNSIEVIRYAA